MNLYHQADQLLHCLSQPIAKINRSFVDRKEDDSHTNLYFDPVSEKLFGRWFEIKGKKYLLSLNLIDQSYEMHDWNFNSLWLVNSRGKSLKEVEDQLSSGLDHLGVEDDRWQAELHFKIPDYDVKRGPIERLGKEAIEEWSHYRSLANYACLDLMGHLQQKAEIRIWPHHFDTGIYMQISKELGIGFGLAMKDEMAGDAYFYLSAYSEKDDLDYERFNAGSNWEWKTGNWKGALITIDQIPINDYGQGLTILNNFCEQAIESILNSIDS